MHQIYISNSQNHSTVSVWTSEMDKGHIDIMTSTNIYGATIHSIFFNVTNGNTIGFSFDKIRMHFG